MARIDGIAADLFRISIYAAPSNLVSVLRAELDGRATGGEP